MGDRIGNVARYLKVGARARTAGTSMGRSTSPTSDRIREMHGRDEHEDVEVATEHYRGAHAASVARAGFRRHGCGGGSGRSGGRGLDPHVAEEFL